MEEQGTQPAEKIENESFHSQNISEEQVEKKEEKKVKPRIERKVLKPGEMLTYPSGTRYLVGKSGNLINIDRPFRVSKKERRRQRKLNSKK